jgi:signal transduction histidine kinase
MSPSSHPDPEIRLVSTPLRQVPFAARWQEVALLARWSIRRKLVFCVALIALIVVALSISGIVSVNAYRRVVRTISFRSAEFPLVIELTRSVDQLVATHERMGWDHIAADYPYNSAALPGEFRMNLLGVSRALSDYRAQIEQIEQGPGISDNRGELAAVARLEGALKRIEALHSNESWGFDRQEVDELVRQLAFLQSDAEKIPGYLQSGMQALKGNARGQYHALIGLTWTTSILSVLMLVLLVKYFYEWVACPLRTVIHASRRVASGDFEHRVEMPTRDEMADLAAGLNAMTSQFKRIRDELDQQVRERTKQVVRSEKLASVGFLAAGVAHEINNPLAAIAMCAESLESRLHDIMAQDDARPDDDHNQEITILRRYLRRIQDESFRCKGITEKLLNYSRLGDAEKRDVDLNEIVSDVVDLLQTLGKYRGKRIDFSPGSPLHAQVVPEEIKQVVLNLIANALDSLGPDGLVRIRLRRIGGQAELVVQDNGCGMNEETQRHLFEPFFTRRRGGQGTGLGLSITYRIVTDHGGTIEANSDGPGQGSLFRVILPLHCCHEERYETVEAA